MINQLILFFIVIIIGFKAFFEQVHALNFSVLGFSLCLKNVMALSIFSNRIFAVKFEQSSNVRRVMIFR